MPKLQYYSDDLARLLSIGKITDMFVVVEDGKQILRIECTANPGNEYKTVTTKGTKKTSKPVSHKGSSESRESRPNNPEGLGQKVMGGVKEFMKNKNKPQFMEDAGF